MSVVDKIIIEEPNIVRIVECSIKFSEHEKRMFNFWQYERYEDVVKKDLVNKIAEFLFNNDIIRFDEKVEKDITTINAKLFVIDLSKAKKE